MRNFTPQELSTRLALAIASLVSILISFLLYLRDDFVVSTSIFTFILSYLACYFLFLWGIKHFIERRFRLIYKTIHNLKLGLKKESSKIDVKEDIFGKIRNEVIEWDKNNRQEIERLTDQEQFRREFLGNVSHELKTPIFSIQGYILTLLEGGLEDKEINRSFLLKAEKGISRMIEMIDDLDEIAKLETNRIELNIQKFDLIKITKEVFESVEDKAKKKNIRLKLNSGYKNLYVMGDSSKIAQVLTNLLVNSINYGTENGSTSIQFFDLDENVLIEVKDTGKGIEEVHLPRLFERFYRIDKGRSRADGGSGLGLAIVKHIIEAHNQTINVRSIFGKGSVFSFTLQKA